MKTVRIVGDVHGKIKQYLKIIEGCEESIQVGDMGAGFVTLPELDIGHKFIRGNHDNPTICKQSYNWIEDGIIRAHHIICYLLVGLLVLIIGLAPLVVIGGMMKN